jgi:hypothetical protein
MYKHIKKHGNQLSKKELPDGFQPSDVLEDLLRNGPIGRMESRIALSKVLIRGYVPASTLKPDKLAEAIELLSHESITDPRFILIQAIARGIQNESPLEALTILSELPEFIEWKLECRRSEVTEHARKAIALLAKGVAAEYAFPLVSLAAEILGDVKVLRDMIGIYCKTKPLSPFPYIALARLSSPEAAFKLIEPLVLTNAPNIVNLFSFDFKTPFLMARPDDGFRYSQFMLILLLRQVII